MKKVMFATLLFLLVGCGSDDNILADIFIPNVSNQWTSDRGSRFFFNPDERDVNESDFTGSEQTDVEDVNGDDFFELSGHFKNYDITFTINGGLEQGVKYTGKFIKGSNPLRIEVTGTNGKKIKITQVL
jgi:hypothetical protein